MNPALTQIELAVDFLIGSQNVDGGMAATRRGDASGCWTTAALVATLLDSIVLPIRSIPLLTRSIQFLISSQRADGSWPVVLGSQVGSTMATAQATGTLAKARLDLDAFPTIPETDVSKAIARGREWLVSRQDNEGAWGVEPDVAGGGSPKTIATVYAADAFAILDGKQAAKSPALRRALDWLAQTQTRDGAWGDFLGGPATVGSTSRVLSFLSRIDDPSKRALVRRGMKYLLSNKDGWVMGTETYVAPGAPGQTRFHFNTLCDIGHALVDAAEPSKVAIVDRIIAHAYQSQSADGSWPLFDFVERDHQVTTWSTGEWLGLILKRLESDPVVASDRLPSLIRIRRINRVLLGALAVMAVIVVMGPLASAADSLTTLASQVSPSIPTKYKLLVGFLAFVVPALLLGIGGNLLTPRVARWLSAKSGSADD